MTILMTVLTLMAIGLAEYAIWWLIVKYDNGNYWDGVALVHAALLFGLVLLCGACILIWGIYEFWGWVF